MNPSLTQFLGLLARRQTRVAGGSLTALAAACAAALLEKLTRKTRLRRELGRLRRRCGALITRDAEVFGQVVGALRRHQPARARRYLLAATRLQQDVAAAAARSRSACRVLARTIPPHYRSDLLCAQALAGAAATGARALIQTNQAWLADLARSGRRPGRSSARRA